MTGKVRHLLNRDGRYFARLVVPVSLRPYLDGKTELRTALGPDRRTALARLPGAVAALQNTIGIAERRREQSTGRSPAATRFPLTADQIALRNYEARLTFDDDLRNRDHRYSSWGYVDENYVADLRDGIAGRLDDAKLDKLVGAIVEHYRNVGNTDARIGTHEWRILARAICISEYEALSRVAERDEGDFSGEPTNPLLANATPATAPPATQHVSLDQIISAEVARRARGKDAKPLPPKTVKKYRDAASEFSRFRQSDNAATITALEGTQWLESMQDAGTLSNRTVKMKLQNVRTVLNWGRRSDRTNLFPNGNPLSDVQLPDYQKIPSWMRAYTIEEAKLVLAAARNETLPMFRWIPWLCAYSGMRVSEAGSLRKKDFFQSHGRWFWLVTTAGGRSLKTESSERRIPVHPILEAEGLIEFVQSASAGRLFVGKTKDDIQAQPRLSKWVRNLIPFEQRPELSPNHGWRHLFEDFCRRDLMSDDARKYITGRTDGSSQEDYGRSDVMLPGLAAAMDRIIPISLP